MSAGHYPSPKAPQPAAAARAAGTPAPGSRPADQAMECAVLFLDVVRYSEQPIATQLDIKQRLNRAVKEATARLAPSERILLDAGDGVAIAFLSRAEDALFVALSLQQALGAPPSGRPVAIRTGVNFGRVSVLRDLNGQPSVIGDGINMAQRVMSFANPGQLLVSRTFHAVLIGLSEDYAGMFSYCGSRTDKHVREHELYELAIPMDQMARIELPRFLLPGPPLVAADDAPEPPVAAVIEDIPPAPNRTRTALWLASGALAVSLAIGVHALTPRPAAEGDGMVREARATAVQTVAGTRRPAPEASRPAKPARAARLVKRPAPASVPGAESVPPAQPAESWHEVVPQAPEDAPSSATLAFVIAPWGEVVVDGQSYGASPPLTHLPVPAGEHRVEIHNGVSDPYRTVVRLEPGQGLRIRHNFEVPRPTE